MKKNRAFIWIIFLLTLVAGCAVLDRKPPKEEKPVQAYLQEEKPVQAYLQKGQEYEQKGNLLEASKQYKLALALNPHHPVAKQKIEQVNTKLRVWAERHYQAGLKFRKEGKYRLTRQEFREALRLWPDHPNAAKMLAPPKQVQVEKFVVHTIKPDESLSKIAKIYYGDYRKFSIIAHYNKLPDATKVKVGQKIKIPEIKGVPFLPIKQDIEAEDVKEVKKEELTKKKEVEEEVAKKKEVEKEVAKKKEEVEEEVEAPVDTVANSRSLGIELFNKKKYQEAIVEFNKVVNVIPDDETALEYLYRSHFQQAMALFEKEDYLAARSKFEETLRYKRDCRKCQEYIKKSEDAYKEIHYKKGGVHFRKEQLVEAIREWELVQAVDPNYKEVEYNINMAKTLLKRLEEIK